ncbi:MAG: hypothetical protein WDZ30_10415 [Cellvibrionaceae bacterium]
MRHILSIIVVIAVVACSDEKSKESQALVFSLPPLKGKSETTQLIESTWDRLLQRCPGLKKYQEDLTFSGINDMIDPVMEEMSRAEVVFKVSNTSQKIPNGFSVHGHTCGFGISPSGNSLRIQKEGCVSLCLNKKYNGPTDYVSPL